MQFRRARRSRFTRSRCCLSLQYSISVHPPIIRTTSCVPTGIRNQEFPQGFYSGMGHVRSGSGTPGSRNSRGGYPGSGTAQYTQGGSKKNSGANAAEERSVPCPHTPRNLWQIFNGIEQNEKMKCCGQKYWDFTPSKILEHFGLQSTRETAAKSLTGARVSSSC